MVSEKQTNKIKKSVLHVVELLYIKLSFVIQAWSCQCPETLKQSCLCCFSCIFQVSLLFSLEPTTNYWKNILFFAITIQQSL